MRARAIGLLILLASASACQGMPSRFALRPPVLREADDRPIANPWPVDDESDDANTIDEIVTRPIAHTFLLEVVPEARNVNALDEVPNSTWFQNRAVSPADLARGPCPDDGPVPPLTIKHVKASGTTPGMVVTDSRKQKYLVKLDDNGPAQPEITTAADAIVARLYWAIGFNAPCNDVVQLAPADFRLTPASEKRMPWGARVSLHDSDLAAFLALATPARDGKKRMSANRWIPGEGVGTWRTEGTRAEDPNDSIAHEDRRELRGERMLAAWVRHWDTRGPNTFDSFVRVDGGRGYVVHYFNDFNDSLGGIPIRTPWPESRIGFSTVSNLPAIVEDIGGFGFLRRSWDDVQVDPHAPDLGFFDVAHFDPMEFAPQTPSVRWARADAGDIGWIARRIARLSAAHVRVAVQSGKLSRKEEEDSLFLTLMGRREKILHAAFERTSPLADVTIGADRICVTDLSVTGGVSPPERLQYGALLRTGVALTPAASIALESRGAGTICATLPHFAPDVPKDDAAERYAAIDIVRADAGMRTTLRAHLYDLGANRGHVLAGVERLSR